MSGLPWFELDTNMPDDPKCLALAARLGEPLAEAYVVRLYAYCYRHATSRLRSANVVETSCGWRGDVRVLFDALLAEGFLDATPEGDFEVHGVMARLGPHLAKRERDRVRMAKRRLKATKGITGKESRERRPNVAGDKDKDKDHPLRRRTLVSVDPFPVNPPLPKPVDEMVRDYEEAKARGEVAL